MSGAEEFQRFTPRIRDDMYLPDEHMTQDIMASGTRRKLADLQRMGEVQARGAAIPGQAIENAYGAYNEGKARRMSEEDAKQRYAMNQQSMKGTDQQQALTGVQLQRAQAQQAEENANREFMDQTGASGQTRRQQLQQAELQGRIDQPGFTRDEHTAHMAEISKSMKQMDMQIAAAGMVAQDHQELKQRADIQEGFAGIYGNRTLTPEQQDQQATAFEQQHAGGKVPPQVVSAYRVAGRNGAAAAQAQGAMTSQVLLQGTEPYQHMAHATGSAQSDAQTIQHLGELRNQYNNTLRFGVGLGKAGDESNVATQARNDFADSLDAMQKHDLADHVRSAGITSVGGRMDDVIKTLAGQTKAAWAHEKTAIHPTMAQRPEVQQADQMIAGLDGVASGKTAKNQISLAPGVGPTSGTMGNASFLKGMGGGQMPPPPQQQQGQIVPAGYNMGATPQANGQRNAGQLPTQNGMLTPPGFPGQAPPSAYPYDFSKYQIHPQQPASSLGGQ